MVYLSVGCEELCLQIGLSVHWLGLCLVLDYLFHVWGGVGVGLFYVLISSCTELLCFGRGI